MRQFSTYSETIDYLFEQLPMYQRVGAVAYKKDLTNTYALLEGIGNPHEKIKTIHVAGTNGKGTTSHIIAFGLMCQNYKVGLYTSPHYKDFRERIKVNGQLAEEDFIVQFVNDNLALIQSISPSFFEITVAMAFAYFHHCNVDVAVIEVGLGGRLDSTNIITPLLSVITNISLDHTDMLGSTIPLIAEEKAGIIKHQVPVLIGERQKETHEVFLQKTDAQESILYYAEDLVQYHIQGTSNSKVILDLTLPDANLSIHTSLVAPYQWLNIRSAIAALYLLQPHFDINMYWIASRFMELSKTVRYIGRWQIFSESPLIILDSAHNIAGIQKSLDYLSEHDAESIHFVLGFVKDKDILKILSLLPKNAKYYWTQAAIPRALKAEELSNAALPFQLHGQHFSTVIEAFQAAQSNVQANEVIYVGGSIFVVAEVI